MDQEMKQEVTIEQLMDISIEQLNNIVVPIQYLETIGLPISRVINNLKIGVKAINDAKAASKPKVQTDSDEPQIDLVEARPMKGEGDIS